MTIHLENFTKIIPIKFDVKDASLKEAERKIDVFTKNFQNGMKFDGLKKELETAFESKAMIAQIDELIAELDGLHGAEIDAFRSSLQSYRDQLEPVKSMNQLLESQYDLHQQIVALEKSGDSSENLEVLRQMSSELEKQISMMGTDGQLAILEERRRIEEEILELSVLNTKEAKDKIKALKEQGKWLGKNYKVEKKDNSDIKDKFDDGLSGSIDFVNENASAFGQEFSSMTSNFGSVLKGFNTSFVAGLAAVGTAFIASFADVMKSGQEAAKDLLSSSRLSDSGTRDTMFTYGTDKAGAYGLDTAMEIFGFSSMDDIAFAAEDDPKTYEKFMSSVQTFANKYSEMESSGLFDRLLESELEMAIFEKEMQMEQAEFYIENQDNIKAIKKFTMQIQMILVEIFGKLVDGLTFNPAEANDDKAEEALKKYKLSSGIANEASLQEYITSNDNSKNTNVSVNQTYNGSPTSTMPSAERIITDLLNVVDAALN